MDFENKTNIVKIGLKWNTVLLSFQMNYDCDAFINRRLKRFCNSLSKSKLKLSFIQFLFRNRGNGNLFSMVSQSVFNGTLPFTNDILWDWCSGSIECFVYWAGMWDADLPSWKVKTIWNNTSRSTSDAVMSPLPEEHHQVINTGEG